MKDSFAKNKIRILFIHPSLGFGGAEELRFIALKYLSKNDQYDITVCCIEKIGGIGEAIKRIGINVFCLNRSSVPYNIFTTISLWGFLLRNRFDIVQTSLFNANFHGRIAAALARVPVVFSEEHSEHYQYNSLKFMPYIWADKILSLLTDKIICCSRNLMGSISRLEHIPLSKFLSLVNVFDVDKLKITKNPSEIRKELGLSNEDLVIGNIASLSHRKGQDISIKAFKIINDKLPSTKLIFIGDEVLKFKHRLINLIERLDLKGKVFFLGRKADVSNYLNIMDIFLLSSRFEGIPLVMLEAMYMQVPVVATNVGGVSEVIHNSKNGILVEPNNVELLSEAVIKILNDKEKQRTLTCEGKKTVVERFIPERYVEDLDNLYKKVMEKRSE